MSTLWVGLQRAPLFHSVITPFKRSKLAALAGAMAVFQRVVQLTCTAFLMRTVLGELGPEKFGLWGVITSLTVLLGFLDLGVNSAVVTSVARAIAQDRPEDARSYLKGGAVILSGIGAAGFVVGTPFVLLRAEPAEIPLYLLSLAMLSANFPLGLSGPVFVALQRGSVTAVWDGVQAVVILAATSLAVHTSHSVAMAVLGTIGGGFVTTVARAIHLFFAHPEVRPERVPADLAQIRRVASDGSLFMLASLVGGLSYMLDGALALSWLGAAAAAQMTIAHRITIAANTILGVMTNPLWPAFTDAATRGDRRWIARTFVRMTILVTVAAIAGSTVIVAGGESALRWFLRRDLGFDARLLWVIFAWEVILAVPRVANLYLNALSILRFQIAVFAVSTALSFAIKYALVKPLGIAGILLGTPAACLLVVWPAFFVMTRHLIWQPRDQHSEPLSHPEPAVHGRSSSADL
ncbi:MAG TPA: MATE family efflux transporter [Polyangiales bacterium]|nr:MATE family efflux transporter [Polyangiales bacterium]